jgi:hypothetical protein
MILKHQRVGGATEKRKTIIKSLKSSFIKSTLENNLDSTLIESKLNTLLSKEKFMKNLNTQVPGFNPLSPLVEKPKENKQ